MKPALFVTALLMLTACDAGADQRRQTMDDAEERVETVSPTPVLTPSGEAQALPADEDEYLQWSASVVRVDYLDNQGEGATVKLFGTAGGDPAMNGLYTHIAFYGSVMDGWRTFRIGDFLDYRVLAASRGRVDLEISESYLDPATDEIGSRVRRLIVTWNPPAQGAPETVSVTEAQ